MPSGRPHATLLLALAVGCHLPPPGGLSAAPDADAPTLAAPPELVPPATPGCDEAVRPPGGATADADQPVFGAPVPVGPLTVGPDPSQVHLGWPGPDTSTSLSFVWNTDPGTLASTVEWGAGEALDQRASGLSFRVGDAPYRVHELRLCGRLTPGTTYRYRVGGPDHWSPTYSFTTPGAPGSFDRFTVAIAGDSRGSYAQWGEVVTRMASHDPDLFLFSGDMVGRGDNAAEWLAWWSAAGDTFARKVVVPAHGNHELLSALYFAAFSLPGNEQWFHVDYGNATVVSLNDTVATPDDLRVTQAGYLRDTLSASTAAWRIAVHHRAEYSVSAAHGSAMDVRAAWAPVFDTLGVDLVFAGHNHLYERSKPVRDGAVVPAGEGTVFFVSGGAGAPLYREVQDAPFNASVAVVEHYLIAEFGPTRVTITARDLADNVLDTVTLPRRR